jgi:hypothetical protein
MNIEHNLFGIATFWRGKLRQKLIENKPLVILLNPFSRED